MPSPLAADVRVREVWAWSMYDFANSAYTTVVVTAVFGAYFVGVVAKGEAWATFAWTAALSVSYGLILVTGPLVGAWADAHAAKKRLLFLSTVGCVLFTALLFFASPGAVALSLALVIVSNYFFGTGENLIAAFLPELADSRAMGRVSGWGWSFGYLGGLAALGICLWYITRSQNRGFSAEHFVPVTMLITAAFFALAATPTFLFLKERALAQRGHQGAWQRLLETWRNSGRYLDLRRFLVCLLFYQAGITAVVALAAIYAEQAMKFTTQQTVTLILVVNITAALGAFGFGYLQDRIGHVRAVALTLVGWIVMVLLAGFSQNKETFWLAANLAGLCMGSSQAAGRAIVGYLAPPARLAEFFGLWGLSVKAASIFGPLTYGVVTLLFAGNHRLGIFATGIYFVIGLALLTGIDVERGRRAALEST
ncbi:MAG TPA: MFS transporter [Burkholderiales bacterium]|nr:MFS transporter [Burkholderiales bacterium]